MQSYQPVNRCIYCYRLADKAGKLTDEHIIAKALQGTLVLPAATCSDCAKITSAVELIFSRNMYGALRVRENFPSRRRHKEARSRKIGHIVQGQIIEEEVAPTDYPGIYLAAELPPPALIDGRDDGHTNPEMTLKLKGNPDQIAALSNNGEPIALKDFFDMGAFHKTIAKTAHAFAVASLGFEGYEALLPAVVLGKEPNVFDLIGGMGHRTIHSTSPLAIEIKIVTGDPYLVVALNLLGTANGVPRLPTYLAIAGRITDLPLIIGKMESG